MCGWNVTKRSVVESTTDPVLGKKLVDLSKLLINSVDDLFMYYQYKCKIEGSMVCHVLLMNQTLISRCIL